MPQSAEARIGLDGRGCGQRRTTMYSALSLSELDDRIAIVRDNLRQLVEQAAATSGSQNEERIADRIAQQEEELSKLVRERDSRAKK
jgi:predicted RNA-binding protein